MTLDRWPRGGGLPVRRSGAGAPSLNRRPTIWRDSREDLLQNFRVEVAEVAELEARLERPGQMWR